MLVKKEPKFIEDSFISLLTYNLIPVKAKLNLNLDTKNVSKIIDEKQKDYFLKKNISFFFEYEKLYKENILLKNKLNELLNEKKNLNKLIIKLEQRIKLDKKENNKNNNTTLNTLKSYKKKKRNRRKKKEITNIYNCTFNKCNKSYPTKSSLNMHIKLKHRNQNLYNFENEK